MFRFLRTKLTVVYTALFGVILLMVAGAVYLSVKETARQSVEQELISSVAVFDRLWEVANDNLAEGSSVLARDFGFRQAVATGDTATIASALDNLRGRIDLDSAIIILADGQTVVSGAITRITDLDNLVHSLEANDRARGVLMEGNSAYQAVAAPVMAPQRVGWVIFAAELDKAYIDAFEELSAIPISASLTLGGVDASRSELFEENGAIGAAKQLSVLTEMQTAYIEITYPLSEALAPYRSMLFAIGLFTLIGALLLICGSWFFARSLTLPIVRLDEAAKALAGGEKRLVDISSRDEVGRLAESFNSMVNDIADREAEIRRLANEDIETCLPNRRALNAELSKLVEERGGNGVLAVSITIKRLQHIRNAIGHANTSKVIVALATRLENLFEGSLIAHVSPARIAFILPTNHPLAEKSRIKAAVDACAQPVLVEAGAVDLLLSAGIARAERDCINDTDLVDLASVAADQAVEANDLVREFDKKAYGDPALTLSLMSEMSAALVDGHMFLALQPKYSCRSETVIGVEALIRWKHPERGFIFPDEFIPIAEETGHIRRLTDWVIEEAIREQVKLRAAGYDIPISVNVSGRQVTERGFAEWAIEQVRREGANLCFEITETAVIDDPQAALDVINMFRDAGISISIDDYGAGLSSLSYLKQIPANELKIDKSFILNLAEGSSDMLLIKSTIDLAHALGMSVVAEGVETAESLALLQGMGADIAQGYFIARPKAMDDLLSFLAIDKTPQAQPKAGHG